MKNSARLVFRGELQPGFQQADVAEPLARLLKISPERVEAVFKARRVVLKQNLSPAQIQPYAHALEKIGLVIHIEDMPAPQAAQPVFEPPSAEPLAAETTAPANTLETSVPPLPGDATGSPEGIASADSSEDAVEAKAFATTDEADRSGDALLARTDVEQRDAQDDYLKTVKITAPYAFADQPAGREQTEDAIAAAEEIDCPKCGHHQAKRTLCLSCGVDMPRYVSAQQQIQEDERGASPFLSTSTSTGTRWEPESESTPPFLSLSFEGRLGRIRYINYFLGAILFLLPCALLIAVRPAFGMAAIAVGAVLFAIYTFRVNALRLHDLGHTGWLSLIGLIPVIGTLFTIAMMILPGNKDSNEYGLPPGPNHRLAGPFALIGLIVLIGFAAWGAMQTPPAEGEAEAVEVVAYGGPREIEMYCAQDASCAAPQTWAVQDAPTFGSGGDVLTAFDPRQPAAGYQPDARVS